ncbi:helix-turn-helix domain-containing protein [Flavobacterium sp. XGLA_31]|uniref:helix-turn-helix domain-containing protein n=1 Tax=Flavobacterium sp. XGLA_31 TaxID=3447666 RepID=UPI003F37C2FF
MLKLNLHQALQSKGIENMNGFLHQCGIPYYTATRLIHNQVGSIPFKYLEKICIHLHCTPDELFIWTPDSENAISHPHPMQKLEPKAQSQTITQKIKQLPFDKIREINNYIDQLNNSQP